MADRFTGQVSQYKVPVPAGSRTLWLVELNQAGDANQRIYRYGYEQQERAEHVLGNLLEELNSRLDENYIRQTLELNFWSLNFSHNYIYCGLRTPRDTIFIDRMNSFAKRYLDFGYGKLEKVEGEKV